MKSNICLWLDLLLSDVKEIWNCESRDDIKRILSRKLGYDLDSIKPKEKILLELHYHSLLFAKERNFNEEQTSALFSIIKKTHEKAVETPFGNIEDTFAYFKELLACHSVKRPPFCAHVYPIQAIVAITEYAVKTYFQHYKLYKYAFTPKVVMNVSLKYSDIVDEEVSVEGVANTPAAETELEVDDKDITSDLECLEEEESAGFKELKQIVESTLEDEITKLKLKVDEKLKANEENIMRRLSTVNPQKGDATPNTGKKVGAKAGKKTK